MQRFVMPRTLVATLAAAGVVAFSGAAMASGFSSARLGGLHGNTVSISPTSVYWNPGAIGKLEGNQLYIDGMIAVRNASYERFDSADDRNVGKNTLTNLIISPAVAFTTDLGGSNVVLGAGFYAPFGGQAVWDRTKTAAPGATDEFVNDGPQRWFAIDGVIRQLTGSLGAAVRTNDRQFSAGLMLNLNVFQVDTIRARNGDGSDNIMNGSTITEGRSHLDVSSIDLGIGLGVHWNSLDERFAAGASWQSASNLSGEQTLTGTLTNQFGPGTPSSSNVSVRQALPHTFRLGFAYRFVDQPVDEEQAPRVRGELRLGAEMTTWNNFKSQCIVNDDALEGGEHIRNICDIDSNGLATPHPGIIQNLVRNWNVGYGVKLSGSWYLNDRIELGAGIGFDSNSIPDNVLDPALMDMNKLAFDLGGNFQVAKFLAIMVQFTEVMYMTRDTRDVTDGFDTMIVDGSRINVQPSSAGRFTQNIFITNLGLNFKF